MKQLLEVRSGFHEMLNSTSMQKIQLFTVLGEQQKHESLQTTMITLKIKC